MSDIYELFRRIRERPSMYLVRRSIFQFQAFYDGYTLARRELGQAITEEERDFSNFHNWIQERLNAKTNLSWASILLFRSVDERDALELFFQLLDEFINRNKFPEGTAETDEEKETESPTG
jgi:hypothetical protein